MVMRKLTDEEKSVCARQLCKLSQAKELNEGELKKTQFDIDFLIDHETKLKKIHANTYVKQLSEEIKDNQNTIDILTKQMIEGVEVKEKIEEKEVVENGGN